jgi:hypothetical protein
MDEGGDVESHDAVRGSGRLTPWVVPGCGVLMLTLASLQLGRTVHRARLRAD